jgi:Transposase DDE domain
MGGTVWRKFDVLLYDLTSTYFESDPPFAEDDKRQFGYSRDKRSDCVQVVIALIITPQGLPLTCEVLSGNTADKTTLRDFLKKIESQYGKADTIWLMDRGIPTGRGPCRNAYERSAYLLSGRYPHRPLNQTGSRTRKSGRVVGKLR